MAAVTEIPPITAAPPPPQPRPRVLVVGSLAASVSTAMCLVGLIGIYLARRADVVNTGEAWIPRGLDAQLAQPTMVMLTFGLSIITAVWMIDALRRDDRQHAWIATGLTMMFGLAIVNQVTYSLGLLGASTETEPGTLILTIIWFHVAMTIIGMTFLGVVFVRSLFGQYRRIPDGAAAAAIWWITTALLWPPIWYAIYVSK